jgi:predicted nuclease of predicted toxin-antitoxin system
VRFLVDENLPVRFADLLRTAGHDAKHIAEYGLEGAPDDEVMARARRDQRVVITYDADFATMLVLGGEALPSIVLFRDQRRRPEELARLLLENLDQLEGSLTNGAIAVFDAARVRVREFPLEPD